MRNFLKSFEWIAILVVFMVLMVWAGSAFTNGDPLWFVGAFEARPELVCIYRYGQTVALQPSDPAYAPLVAALNAEIPQHVGFWDALQPAGATLEHYTSEGYAVEARYAQPVRVHTRYYFPPNTRLLLALDGSYDYTKHALLFRGSAAQWLPGGIALRSTTQVRAAADAALPGAVDPAVCAAQ